MSVLSYNFWEFTFLTIINGHSLPDTYIQVLKTDIAQFVSHSVIAWGLIAFSLIVIKILMQKLGRQFLDGISSLPFSLSLQKSLCTIFEIASVVLWLGIVFYAVANIVLGELWFKSDGYLFWMAHTFAPGYLIGTILGMIAGVFLRRLIWKRFEPYCSSWIDQKRKNYESSLTDIRQVYHVMAKSRNFDPTKLFKENFISLGKDEQNLPIYVEWQLFKKTHVQVMGTTGSGKGVVSIIMLVQAMINGAATVIMEPKQGGDEWAPHVLKAFCEKLGKNFYLIDLQAHLGQVNLLNEITPDQLDQLLQAGMGIEDKGSDGDYYRLKDRQAAKIASNHALETENFPHLLSIMENNYSEELKKAESFHDKLDMICQITAFQTSKGLNLQKAIKNGDCIYIIGSPDRAQIKLAQRMVLLRIKQLIEHRDRLEKHRHVTIFIDEVKYFLTRPVLDALAMIRDHECNLILAHQAPGDLYDVPKDIDGQACYSCVTNNTNIKVLYKINDAKDRRMAASLTGTKVIKRDSKEVVTNSGMGDVIETDRKHTMDMQVPLYDENFFAALRERVGVILGVGVAKICFTSPIKTIKKKLIVESYSPCLSYRESSDDLRKLEKNKKPKITTSINTMAKSENSDNSIQKIEEEFIQFFDESIYEKEGNI